MKRHTRCLCVAFLICHFAAGVLMGQNSVGDESNDDGFGDYERNKDWPKSAIAYINTNFENASPLYAEINEDGLVQINFLQDRERNSPNKAGSHWHFQVQAEANSEVTLILRYFDEIWNGKRVKPYSDIETFYVSPDGKKWSSIPVEAIGDNRLRIRVSMQGDSMYVAGVEPYRLSDLEKLLAEIKGHPQVEITTIGKTVQGRPLEMVRIGNPEAPHRVLLRGRAHPWESGGSWILEGLIRSLLDARESRRYLDRYCVYILPMANKDGVANGWTRFNATGTDLNRGWGTPADPHLSPENFALEKWIDAMIAKGKKPDLYIDLHNDRVGRLHKSLPNDKATPDNMNKLESLLYKHTWFTVGSTEARYSPNSIGGRYNMDACTLEFNRKWIDALKKPPFGKDWELFGRQFRDVFYHYFSQQK